jgi:hypothetical protein
MKTIHGEIVPEPESKAVATKSKGEIAAEVVSTPKYESVIDVEVIDKYYVVTLVLNNLVERTYLFTDVKKASNKFLDMCREFSYRWRETNADLALEQEYWTIEKGSVNINSPICINE